MWYDKFKKEKILIHRSDEHNKFWAASWDDKKKEVLVRWGRLGTKGQSQIKSFGSERDGLYFIAQKYDEKLRKDYSNLHNGEEITQATLDLLAAEAAIIGTQNKCHNFSWVEVKRGDKTVTYEKISDSRLYDPDCDPGILVDLEMKQKIDGRNSFKLLFTSDGSYDIKVSGFKTIVFEGDRIVGPSKLSEMVAKVEQAIGRNC